MSEINSAFDSAPASASELAIKRILGLAPSKHTMGWILVGLVCSCLFDATAQDVVSFACGRVVGVALLLSVAFLPLRYLPYPLLIILINAPDQTQGADEMVDLGQIDAASPWQLHLGSIPPAMLILVALVYASLRLFATKTTAMDRILIGYFLIVVPIISFLFGYPQESLGRFITDAKFGIFFCLALLLLQRYYLHYPDAIIRLGQVMIALIIGRFALDCYYLFGDVYKTVISGYNRVSVDSTKGLLCVLIFAAIAQALYGKHKLICVGVLPVLLYLLVSYQTRWLVVTLAVGALLILVSLNVMRSALLILVCGCLIAVAIPLLEKINPDVIPVMVGRFNSMGFSEGGFDPAALDSTRVLLIKNSMAQLVMRRALFYGFGYGSWYSDDYVLMPRLDISAFEEDALDKNQYYRVHDFLFHMLFKVGVIGLLLYLLAFILPLIRYRSIVGTLKNGLVEQKALVVFLGAFPTFLTTFFWSSKGLVLCGFYVASVRAWMRLARAHKV
jgi:hypothetical protein